MVLEKEMGEGGRLKKNISVEAVREIGQFFALAPSRSKYRVCIIDSVDELNISSSNALLKILEEPPKNGIIFLISHSSGKLLSTIRSRCRRLNFTPWHEEDLHNFLIQHIDIPKEKILRLVHLAKGAPGKSLNLHHENALELDSLAAAILSKQPIGTDEISKISTQFRANNSKSNGLEKFSLFLFCLMDQVHSMSLTSESLRAGEQLSDFWQKLAGLFYQHETINLDRGDIFINIYNDLNDILS
jgi:DNA polymerase-3 subunit delta'